MQPLRFLQLAPILILGAIIAATMATSTSAQSNKTVVGPLISPAEQHLKPLTKPIDVTGEVVDTWCYASQVMGSGRGPNHLPCGLACAHGGVTLGIVDDKGVLYVAAKYKGYTGCKDLLTPYMAKRVKVHGWLAEKGGSRILKIQTVALAK